MNPELLISLLLAIPGFLLAIVCHEAAHAWTANRLGDPTAKMLGRVTLNPLRHLDPWGTVILPLLLLISSQGSMVFGYARPVPVTGQNFRNPRRDGVLVSLAGPAANLLCAIGMLGLAWLGRAVGFTNPGFLAVLKSALNINLILAAFNLIPLPPLDGSELVAAVLPGPWAYRYQRLAPYGFLIILGLYFIGALQVIMVPIYFLLQAAISPFGNPF